MWQNWYIGLIFAGSIVLIGLGISIWIAIAYSNIEKLNRVCDRRGKIILRVKARVEKGEEPVSELDRVVELYNEGVYFFNKKISKGINKWLAKRYKIRERKYFDPEHTKDYKPKRKRVSKKEQS